MFGPESAFFKTGRLRGSVVPNGTMLMVNSECSRYGKGYLILAISLNFEEPHATAVHPFPTSTPPQGKARAQVSGRWAASVTSQPDQRETECVGLGEACGGVPAARLGGTSLSQERIWGSEPSCLGWNKYRESQANLPRASHGPFLMLIRHTHSSAVIIYL